MASRSVVSELIQGTKKLVAEKEALEEKLKYYESALTSLEADNREYARRVDYANAHDTTTSSSSSQSSMQWRSFRSVKDTDWMCNWLYCTDDKTVLTPVEEAWREGKPQRALALLTPIMKDTSLTESERADCFLLLSSILRSTGDYKRALLQAEEAVCIAVGAKLHHHVGKANFHRGVCYANMDKLVNAWWCYTLAAHTEGHEELIQTNRDIVERMMQSIPKGDQRLQLSIKETDSTSHDITKL